MAVTVEVLEGLGPVAEAWDRVVDLDGANPFLRSWWLSSTTLGKARVVAVHDGPDLVGGLALGATVRLVDQHSGVRQGHPLSRRTRSQQHG